MLKSTSEACIISMNELGTAWGNALGWGAQERTTLGIFFVFNSSIVMASAKAWSGWPVALSMFTIGTVAYLTKLVSIHSDWSLALFIKDGNALTAKISAYWEITWAASLTCSEVSKFITTPDSNSNSQESVTFNTVTSMPKCLAAFSVLNRVRRLALKNNMTRVFWVPKFLYL